MKPLRVRSYAKINLALLVMGVREDGYHELRSLFQSVDLHDDLVLRPRRQGIVVRCDHPGVPGDGTNLAARAAAELARYAKVQSGVEIEITKRIPVAAGLGGGSSNAAATLLALDRLWKLRLDTPTLHRLARRLGADVPYFLVGGTALGLARGDEIYPLRGQLRAHVVIADPGRPVSTATVFRRLDARLTPRENADTIFYFVSSDLGEKRAYRFLSNDLEDAALEEAPDLREAVRRIRGILVRHGAAHAALSGSGSSCFGVFEDRPGAQRAHAALLAAGFAAHRCRTLTLEQYRRAVNGRS
jgi:4-diphosphocytidyl-2-C-methyl-D-erythritol kinase